MIFKEFKDLIEPLCKKFEEKYAHPNKLLQTLTTNLGTPLPSALQEAFNEYQKAYFELLPDYQKSLNKLIELTAKKTGDEDEVGFDEESQNFLNLFSSFERQHVNLQIVRNVTYREQTKEAPFSADEKDTGSERIVLTNQDFSDNSPMLGKLKQKIQAILTIVSGQFDHDQFNSKFTDLGHTSLNEKGINNNHFVDYFRRGYTFLNNDLPELARSLKTNDYLQDDLETVVQAYLTHHKLDQKAAPNVRAMITTLAYQSGLQGMGFSMLAKDFIHHGMAESFHFTERTARTAVFFDQETGKLRLDMFMERDIEKLPERETVIGADINQKITLNVDMERDANGNPHFIMEEPQVALSIVRPLSFAKEYPTRISESDLRNAKEVDSQYVDSFYPFLEDIAKFAGYPSLEEIYYEPPTDQKTEKNRRFHAKDMASGTKFNDQFTHEISRRNPKLRAEEKGFLDNLRKSCYEDRQSKSKLSRTLFTFIESQLSSGQLSHPDKLRYIHLLKVAVKLGNDNDSDKKRASQFLDDLVTGRIEMNEEERLVLGDIIRANQIEISGMSRGEREIFRQSYQQIYDGKNTIEEVSNAIVNHINNGLNEISYDKTVDETRFKHFIQLALDYSVPLPAALDPQKIIDVALSMPNSQKALFQAAKLNQAVYQRIMEPSSKSIWRMIGEFFGILKPRPTSSTFNNKEHAELLGRHFDWSKNSKNTASHAGFLNTIEPKEKLIFLREFAANQSPHDIKDLNKDFLSRLNKELIELGNKPFNTAGAELLNFITNIKTLCEKGKTETMIFIMQGMQDFFTLAALRSENPLTPRGKLLFLQAIPEKAVIGFKSNVESERGKWNKFFDALSGELKNIPHSLSTEEKLRLLTIYETHFPERYQALYQQLSEDPHVQAQLPPSTHVSHVIDDQQAGQIREEVNAAKTHVEEDMTKANQSVASLETTVEKQKEETSANILKPGPEPSVEIHHKPS